MSGHLRRLPDRGPDVWQARYYIGDGHERTRTFRANTERQAERIGNRILAELAAGDDATVAGYAARWLDRKARTLSPSTIEGSYTTIVDRIIERFGSTPLTDVKPGDIKAWYDQLAANGLSRQTIERHHGVIRAMFREAVEDELIDRVPTTFKRPPAERHELALPGDRNLSRLLIETPGDFGRMIRLSAMTGIRRGELCALTWGDLGDLWHDDGERFARLHIRTSMLELRGGRLVRKAPKSGRTRSIVLADPAIRVVEEQWRVVVEQMGEEPGGHVAMFPNLAADPSGRTPHRPGWVTANWRRVRADYGMSTTRLHDLRHAHATRLLSSGVPINVVAARLGHSKASTTTDIYGHTTPAGELDAARAAFGPNVGESSAP